MLDLRAKPANTLTLSSVHVPQASLGGTVPLLARLQGGRSLDGMIMRLAISIVCVVGYVIGLGIDAVPFETDIPTVFSIQLP
jgi:hypothetical protein